MMRILGTFILSFLTCIATGQHFVGMVAATDSVTIGEPLTLEITVSLSGNTPVDGILDFSTLDTLDNLMYTVDTTFFNKKGDDKSSPLNSLQPPRLIVISKSCLLDSAQRVYVV